MSSEKRTLRSQTNFQKLEESNKRQMASLGGLSHTGFDTTSTMKLAHSDSKQGKLDDTERHTMHRDISKTATRGGKLSDVVPPFALSAMENLRSGKVNVVQQDFRSNPQKGGAYDGFMMTMSRVFSHGDSAEDKEIPYPKSPNPYNEDVQYDRAHRAPYSLVGTEGNTFKTVWAPHYPNIAVDSHMERMAMKKFEKYGDGNVMHMAVDSHDRSTVGVVYDRGDNPGISKKTGKEKPRFKSVFAQYGRKF
ncbi:hypothetical protein [Chitiniphilus shinanonensis]|uniref:hypothetical protein n=1 Tax=Chitiniphilus shinanonensis TaxID=553088 RepID=UPI003021EB54